MKDGWKSYVSKNIRFRGRMLLIFMIGGIIPFLGATIYMNSNATDIMLEQNQKSQQRELKMLGGQIERAVPDMRAVCQEFYISNVLPKMVQKNYTSTEDWKQDEDKLDELDKYLEYYGQSISDIIFYVKKEPLCYKKPFAYLGPSVTNEKWYSNTCAAEGEPYWCFGVDREGKQKCIQVARQILSSEGEQLGILAVQMNMDMLTDEITDRTENTILMYNDTDTIYTNFSADEERQNVMAEKLRSQVEIRGSVRYNVLGEDKLLTYEKVRPMGLESYYTIACVQEYSGLNRDINQVTFTVYIVVSVGLCISFIMILLYSTSFSKRLKTVCHQMHLVATGKYDEVKPMGGNDEIAQIYQELETMMGDIQDLTDSMIEERVQKEKMHTRQKEVEFKMLASQINPHFLYNTLETIRMKARVNHQTEIEDLVKMLAKIMRRNIQLGNQMVSLRSEVELIENYLKIQSYRFGDRIQSSVVVEDAVNLEQEVLPLIIQPFVENAFIHGLEDITGDGLLAIHVGQNEQDIIIEITDNGVGMNYYQLGYLRHMLSQDGSDEQDTTHIGINNVNQRIVMQYGKEYVIRIDSVQGKGTTITIRIPLTKDDEG